MSWPSDFSDPDSFICSDVLEMEEVSSELVGCQHREPLGASAFQNVLISRVSWEAAGAFLGSHQRFDTAEFPACFMVLL